MPQLTGAKPSLLIVEDNASLSNSLKLGLRPFFNVTQTPTINNALNLLQKDSYEAILLDRQLPDGDGLELVLALHNESPHTRICVLSNKSSTADKLQGLRSGADTYLVKPTSTKEVQANLQALLRRGRVYKGELLHFQDLFLDPDKMVAFRDSIHIELTNRETQLLSAFIQAPAGFLGKSQLQTLFWDLGIEASPSLIHVSIQRIRRRLEGIRVTIKTHYGSGYQIELN